MRILFDECNQTQQCTLFITSLDGRIPDLFGSPRTRIWIDLPLIKFKSAKQILTAISPTGNKHLLKALAVHSGGHPRILQAIVSVLETPALANSYLDILQQLGDAFGQRTLLLDGMRLQDLRCVLLGQTIDADSILPSDQRSSYRDLVGDGRFFLVKLSLQLRLDSSAFSHRLCRRCLCTSVPSPFQQRILLKSCLLLSCAALSNRTPRLRKRLLATILNSFMPYGKLYRRLIILDPILNSPEDTWAHHYGLGLGLPSFSLTNIAPARLLVPRNPMKGPFKLFVNLLHSKKADFVDFLTTNPVSIHTLLKQKVPLIIYPGGKNNVPAFDLLTVDWHDQTPQLTFIQLRGPAVKSGPEESEYVNSAEVGELLYELKMHLSPYVRDPDQLFESELLQNFSWHQRRTQERAALSSSSSSSSSSSPSSSSSQSPAKRQRSTESTSWIPSPSTQASSSTQEIPEKRQRLLTASHPFASTVQEFLPSLIFTASQIRFVFVATCFGSSRLAREWGPQVAVLPWEKLRDVYGRSLSQLIYPSLKLKQQSLTPAPSDHRCKSCRLVGHHTKDLQCPEFQQSWEEIWRWEDNCYAPKVAAVEEAAVPLPSLPALQN